MQLEDYAASPEQLEFARTVRQLLERDVDPCFPYDGGPPLDAKLWRSLGDLGVIGLTLGPEYEASATMFDLVIAAEELGRAAAPVPFPMAGVASGSLLAGRAPKDLRDAFAAGDTVVVPVLTQTARDTGTLSATVHGESCRVSGVVGAAVDAVGAQVLLLRATSSEGTVLALVEAGAPGLELVDQPTLDRSRRVARIVADGVEGVVLERGAGCDGALDDARDRVRVAIAAEATGAAARALDLSAAYALSRHQFDRPIGAFQAVKHRLADMLLDVENARSAAYFGAKALDRDADGREFAVAMAKAVSTENSHRAVESAIQLHGAIGVTWEHILHVLLRRTKTCSLLFGDPQHHFEAIGAALADGRLKAGVR